MTTTSKQKVVIYGSGMLGSQVFQLLKEYFHDKWEILGFVDDTRSSGAIIADGICTLGDIKTLAQSNEYNPSRCKLVMAIGYNRLDLKYQAYLNAKNLGYQFETVQHPNAFIEKSVTMGEGNIYLEGVIVDQFVKIGDINYFDISTTVGEKTKFKNGNYIAAGATIAGFDEIGDANFIGIDTTVISHKTIGDRNFINAKTLISSDIDSDNHVIQVHQVRCIKRKL